MSAVKAYFLVSIFSALSFIYQFFKYDNYNQDFVMVITVLIASIVGSSVQIAQKNNKYHIKGKEIILIYLTGFFFAYLAFIIGDSFYHNQTKDNLLWFNPIHLAGAITIISSYMNVRFLEAIKGLVLAVLTVTINGVGSTLIGAIKQFMKPKDE